MQRKTMFAAAAAAVVAVALVAWAFAPRPLEVEVATAAVAPFERVLEEDGRTRVVERFTVSAPLAGRLARIALREGDAVAAGDTVATLTPALAPLLDERSVLAQQARVQAAAAALQRAGAGVGRARVGVEQAQREAQRSVQLARQGFVSPNKQDTDRLAVAAAQKELEAALGAEQVARHELETARAALAAVRGGPAGSGSGRTDSGAFAVRSPVAGRVLRVLQPSEATVGLGTPLVELGDTARLEIVADLLTSDALQAPPGAPVRIERWGGPQALAGRVQRVEPGGFTKVSALGVEEQRTRVVIDLTSPRAQWAALGDGFRVALAIVVQAEREALQVPVSAVFPLPGEGAQRFAVFRLENGRARQVPVVVGARNARTAWVREGLKAGDTVIVYPPTATRDGVRVARRRV